MSFEKVAALAEKFIIKIAENKYENKAPADKKASDFSKDEEAFINSLSEKDNNQAKDIDDKIWNRAKKAVKKYWKGYKEPWAVVYSVYKEMLGKPHKKKK